MSDYLDKRDHYGHYSSIPTNVLRISCAPCWRSQRAAGGGYTALEENLWFTVDTGAEPIHVRVSDVARTLMQIGHEKNVYSIIIGDS
ncbi:MAG: hypothetical protein JO352_33755 [Chloroflexi bacterium]|nr:hypothetical protein [Chloroflexota bacterium]